MLRSTLALLLVALSATLAQAQTGPTGPTGGNGSSGPASTQLTVLPNLLGSDRLASYLQSQGHKVEQRKLSNGAALLVAQVAKDGWSFTIEIEYTLDQKLVNMLCPLGNPISQLSQAQMMELLKANHRLNPNFFNYRVSDSRLCLDGPFYNSTMTEQQFQALLDRFLKTIKESHPIWDSSRYPTTGSATTLPSGNTNGSPTNTGSTGTTSQPANPTGNGQIQSLVNTTWIGSETLQGFGRLEFRFGANGIVNMVDASGSQAGTYSVQGNSVTLAFFNNTVTYTGTINGNAMAGNATNGQKTWTFSVTR